MKKKRYKVALLIPFLLFFALPILAVAEESNSNKEESIYYIVVDRFNNGDHSNDLDVDVSNPNAYYGGDIQGIISRLDHVKEMGFTSILLAPVFENDLATFYPYKVKNINEINQRYGTIEDLNQLVNVAHDNGMKVMLDLGNGSNSEILNDEFIDKAQWWIQETDIDGYKLDLIEGISPNFITSLSNALKTAKEDFLLIGESLGVNNLPELESAGLDSVLNMIPYEEITKFSTPDQTFNDIEKAWDQAREFENQHTFIHYIDNQNTVRFTHLAVEANEHPAPRLKSALTYLYTTPGIPMVLYGTEIALNGTEPPDNFGLMDFRTDEELIEYITLLSKIRSGVPALTKGSLELVLNDKGLLVFKREYEGEKAFVAINNTTKTQSFTLTKDQIGEDKELTGLITEDLVRPTDDVFNVVVKRDVSEVFVVRDTTKINYTLFVLVFIVPVLMVGFIFLNKKRNGKRKPK